MMIELQHVKKKYGDFNLNCSLQVQEGMVTGLIGANGAGKSTTFKAILGLLKADSGVIRVFGKEPEKLTAEEKSRIGVVLSENGFSNYLKVKQIAGILESLYPRFQKGVFLEKCRRFQIPSDKLLKEFSTGMKAKLKVLIATSFEARLLILDEPTSGLDVVARDEILDLLREYMETDGRSILISSHISSDLEGLCDDLYMIDHGEIVLHEETDALLNSYGVLKVSREEWENLDKSCILRVRKESFGYSCLTGERDFYMENYPSIAMEKGSIDEVIFMMIKGEVL